MPSQPQALQRYRLVARLGSGGMADVYLAVARGPSDYKKLVVLKLLRADVAAQEQPGFLQMFLDEGRLAGRLNHPHIIHSYEPGVDAGQHFIAMEYLEGQALNVLQSRWWQEHDAHTVALELFVIAQVLDGLEYAHTLTDYDGTPLNIVHRDVSPQNVFVTYSGHSKLLDFGIAKTLESSQTQGGIVKGKVAYMAPEQVRTRALDRRADLFSVGVMLWECVAGRRMHTDASVFDILKRVGEGDLPKLRDAAPNVSPQLETIIHRALALEPSERYPDAQSFRAAILALPELQGVSARDVAIKLDQLFSKERSDLNRLIHEAMSGTEALDLPSSDTSPADPAWTGDQETPADKAPNSHAPNSHAQLNTLPIIANTVASSSPVTTAASTVPALATVRTWRKSAWFAGAALVVLLAGIASFVSTRRSTSQPTGEGEQTPGTAAQKVEKQDLASKLAAATANPSFAAESFAGSNSPRAATSEAASSNAPTPNASAPVVASPNTADPGATSAGNDAPADTSTTVAAQNTPKHEPTPSSAERSSGASSRTAKTAVPLPESKPKSSGSSPTKTSKGALTSTDDSTAAARARSPKHDWVVPFPKLAPTKSSTDSSARH